MTTVELKDLSRKYGSVVAVDQVSMTLAPGEMLAMLGPSGCGKTTTLRMLAGLEHPTEGTIRIGDRVLASGRMSVPPEDRGIGMVFQSYALWPHMKVFDNVAYGLKLRKISKAEIERRVNSVLSIVDMAKFGERYPSQLSGGQQQRVALARAIALEPDVLLFDEPLSNLDAALRESMRFEIRDLQQRLGTTSLYVTHSQEEALAMADRIAVMRRGRLLQVDKPHDIYHRPLNRFVGQVVGVANILGGTIRSADGEQIVVELPGQPPLRAAQGAGNLKVGDAVDVMLRPERLALRKDGQGAGADGDAPNQLRGTIEKLSYMGSSVEYFVRLPTPGGAQVRVQGRAPVLAEIGDTVTVSFDPDAPWVMPAADDSTTEN